MVHLGALQAAAGFSKDSSIVLNIAQQPVHSSSWTVIAAAIKAGCTASGMWLNPD